MIPKKSYWLYSENVDEAGVVVEAADPHEALREALKLWDPQDGAARPLLPHLHHVPLSGVV